MLWRVDVSSTVMKRSTYHAFIIFSNPVTNENCNISPIYYVHASDTCVSGVATSIINRRDNSTWFVLVRPPRNTIYLPFFLHRHYWCRVPTVFIKIKLLVWVMVVSAENNAYFKNDNSANGTHIFHFGQNSRGCPLSMRVLSRNRLPQNYKIENQVTNVPQRCYSLLQTCEQSFVQGHVINNAQASFSLFQVSTST